MQIRSSNIGLWSQYLLEEFDMSRDHSGKMLKPKEKIKEEGGKSDSILILMTRLKK